MLAPGMHAAVRARHAAPSGAATRGAAVAAPPPALRGAAPLSAAPRAPQLRLAPALPCALSARAVRSTRRRTLLPPKALFEVLEKGVANAFRALNDTDDLSTSNMKEPLQELRVALLEADVALPVVKSFLARVEERAVGIKVVQGVKPREQLIKVVSDELRAALGGEAVPLATAASGPTVILLAGLQGAGKTTIAAKLGLLLKKQGRRPMLVATDTFRPAAIEQLVKTGTAAGVPVFEQGTRPKPADIARAGVAAAKAGKHDVVIIDTAGRVAVNEALMAQLREVQAATSPTETLLVCDAMLGQDAATAAKAFHEALTLTGVILTKLDGDSRGGAALSVRAACGAPIKFCGVGEKLADLEVFYPDRLAGRIVGMGDVVSLVEKAAAVTDQAEAARLATRMLNNEYGLDDFLSQSEMIAKLGPMNNLMKMMPSQFTGGVSMSDSDAQKAESQLKRFKAMIKSMTPAERRTPELVQSSKSRAERIARGSGHTLQDVAELLQSHAMMREMMGKFGGMLKSGQVPDMAQLTGMAGGGGRSMAMATPQKAAPAPPRPPQGRPMAPRKAKQGAKVANKGNGGKR